MKKIYPFLFFTCLFAISRAGAQAPQWGFSLGSAGDDEGRVVKVLPNGNVCIVGRYTGTMDLDPGSGVYNITCSGATDMYVACYTSAGSFIWGFGIGGANYDGAYNIATDAASDVIVGGAFQGPGVDFDPGPGTAILPYAGGYGLPYEGDGFVAKYSSSGIFQWAKDLGGYTVYDFVYGLATDPLGNVYVGGEFNNTMFVSSSITFSSALNGTSYIIKYSPTGTVIWAHNFGEYGTAGVDCSVTSMQISNGFIYACGSFRGSANFDPWGPPAWCSSAGPGIFNPYVAKYDTAGNFVWVKQLATPGPYSFTYNLALDASDNVYLTGWTQGSNMIFDMASPGTSTRTSPGGGGNYDIFMAKYTSAGAFAWGNLLGGPGDDYGWNVTVSSGTVYFTGQFQNTVDMDPGAAVVPYTSAGLSDIYFARYDLSGNYLCGFRTGAAADDIGYGIDHDPLGNIYTIGQFGGAAVDFDPTTGTYPLTSHGGLDAYLVKYTGGLSVSVDTFVCNGIPVTLSGGTGAGYLWSTGDTSSSIVVSAAGSYWVTVGNGSCDASTDTFHVHYAAPVSVNLGNDTAFCAGGSIILTETVPVGATELWSTGATGPAITVSASGTYWVTIDSGGCISTDTIQVAVNAFPAVDLGPDRSVCGDTTFVLQSSGSYPGATYTWSTGSTAPSISVSASGTYWLVVSNAGCIGADTANISIKPQPVVALGHDTVLCPGNSFWLTSPEPPGTNYSWSTGSTDSSILVSAAGIYSLDVDLNGCRASAAIHVTIGDSAVVSLGLDTSLCIGESLVLYAGSNDAIWSNNSKGPSITVQFPGVYWVRLPGQCGAATDTINVDFHICDIAFPSAFTPNGDGHNDVIGVVGTLKYYQDFSLSIYNRFGERVFYTENIYAGWDGIYNGAHQDLGTYFYMIFYSIGGHKHMMKGDFQLIR